MLVLCCHTSSGVSFQRPAHKKHEKKTWNRFSKIRRVWLTTREHTRQRRGRTPQRCGQDVSRLIFKLRFYYLYMGYLYYGRVQKSCTEPFISNSWSGLGVLGSAM